MRENTRKLDYKGKVIEDENPGNEPEANSQGNNPGEEPGEEEPRLVDEETSRLNEQLKQEAMRQRYRTEIIVPLPEAKARGDSHGFMMKEWEKRWRSSDTCKH